MRLRRALEEMVIGGITTTIPLHQALLDRSPVPGTATTRSSGWRNGWLSGPAELAGSLAGGAFQAAPAFGSGMNQSQLCFPDSFV